MGYGIVVRAFNMRELAAYYGNTAALNVRRELYRRLQQVCGVSAVINGVSDDAVIVGPAGSSSEQAQQFEDCDYLDLLLAAISQPEADCPLLATVAVLEARYADYLRADPWPEPRALKIPASAIYSRLELADDVMDAIARDRLVYSFQPVFEVRDTRSVLYHECAVHVCSVRWPYVMALPSFMSSLLQLGKEREFEQHSVRSLIEQLRANRTVSLECTIHSGSAIHDAGWTLLEAFQADKYVASRLVIGIDERAHVSELTRPFVEQLQWLGCRLAIDHFGVGLGFQTSARITNPDIIKTDPVLLQRACQSTKEASQLARLVKLACDFAPDVVVDGLDRIAELSAVASCDAVWAMGAWIAQPGSIGLQALQFARCG